MTYDKIILISVDTLRADCLAATPARLWEAKYGALPRPWTAPIDQLVTKGCFFSRCVSTAPYTSASHGSFLTGLWPPNHGVFEFFNRPLKAPTLMSLVRSLGYHTVFKTDFPIILGKHLRFDQEIDDYLIEDDAGFITKVAAHGRAVGFCHFGGAHIPYGFHSLAFGGDDYRGAVAALEAEIGAPDELPADQLVETYRSPEDLHLLLRYKRIIQHLYARADYTRLFRLYLEGLEYFLRRRLAAFLETLLRALAGTRHLVVLFGDHGEEYDAGSYGHHNSLAEGVVRVPLVFYGPDVRPALHADPIRSIDLVPTVLDRMGLEGRLGRLDGTTLADTVWGGAPYPTRTCFSQAFTSDTAEFVAYQKRLLAEDGRPGVLRHVLYKEAVWDRGARLRKQSYEYFEHGGVSGLRPCKEMVEVHAETSSGLFEAADEQQSRLEDLLAAYNALRDRTAPTVETSEGMRAYLRAIGYRV